MDWYNGVSLLEYPEEVEVNTDTDTNSRFQVQYVIRPQNMKYFADSYENNEQGESRLMSYMIIVVMPGKY